MRVILHAGLPKTGSTSIQYTFAANRTRLAEAGIQYPELDTRHPSHWLLCAFAGETPRKAYLARRTERLPSDWAEATVAKIDRLLEECGRTGQTLLLSDEGLGGNVATLKGMAAMFARYNADVSVFAYVRPPLDLVPSWTQQIIKDSSRPVGANLLKVGAHQAWKVAALGQHFGPERVHTRIFARPLLTGGSVVTDLVSSIEQTIGVRFPELVTHPTVNESLSAAACAVLMLVKDHHPAASKRQVYSNLRQLMVDLEADRPAPKLRVPESWRDTIIARNAEAWNGLVAGTSHSDEEKARFYLTVPDDAPQVTDADMRDWIVSAYDPEYVQDVIALCRTHKEERWARVAAKALMRLGEARRDPQAERRRPPSPWARLANLWASRA